MATFQQFVELYDRWRLYLRTDSIQTEADEAILATFFDFVGGYEFKLSAPEEEVQAELERIMNEKWWKAKLDFIRGGLELIRTGVKLADMLSIVKDSFRIDPSLPVRLQLQDFGDKE